MHMGVFVSVSVAAWNQKVYDLVYVVPQELHSKVVCQYSQFYKMGPPLSGNEESLYWFRYLTYHMAQAELSKVSSLDQHPLHGSYAVFHI